MRDRPGHAGRVRSGALLLAALALACGGDTDVQIAIVTTPPPPPGTPGGRVQIEQGAVIAFTASSAAAASPRAPERRRDRRRVHADRLYLPSPRGPARIAADDHALAADAGSGGRNYDADTNVSFGNDGRPRHAFLRARLRDLPRRARILDATLQILARFGDAEPDCDVYLGLVPKDGRWDAPPRMQWSRAPSFDGIVTVRDGAGATLATTGLTSEGAANFGLEDTGERFSLVSSTQVGQSATVTAGGALAEVQVQLRRSGSVSGDTRIRVERCRADDGSDDRPDGVPLGVSAPIAASEIATRNAGSLMSYAFDSGPSLVEGARYAFILESDAAGSAENHVEWKIQHGDSYPSGGLLNYGPALAWNIVSYPEASQLPFFFAEDQITPRTPPFGTLTRIEVPPFPAAGTWVDVADVATQLQEWVDGPDYAPNDVVAIQLFTAHDTPEGARRRGKDFRLRVTWRER